MTDQPADPATVPLAGSAAAHTSAKGSWSWRLKSAYAGGARALGRALTRARLLPADPPPRTQRLRHWAVSLPRVHDALAIADLGVPWWTYRSIDEIERWLADHGGPVRAFEWGSGASTIWLADRVEEITSVEHHPEALRTIAPVLATLDRVRLLGVPAVTSTRPAIGSRKLGSKGLDFTDYVHAIDSVPGTFDLIVIDGRAREACLRVAIDRLADGGIIVFDNTQRRRYRVAIETSGLEEQVLGGLTPTLPYPDRTSLLRVPAR